MINGFIIPVAEVEKFRLRLDEYNIMEPVPIREGTHKGKFFIDSDITKRDSRWTQKLTASITDKAIKTDLALADLKTKETK